VPGAFGASRLTSIVAYFFELEANFLSWGEILTGEEFCYFVEVRVNAVCFGCLSVFWEMLALLKVLSCFYLLFLLVVLAWFLLSTLWGCFCCLFGCLFFVLGCLKYFKVCLLGVCVYLFCGVCYFLFGVF